MGRLSTAMLIALDSNVFIAALSQNEEYSSIAQQLIRDIAQGKHRAITSSIAYGEILSVSTSNENNLDLESFFVHIENLSTIPAGDDICLKAGQLRKQYGPKLKLPDALHTATAMSVSVDMFITNDITLSKITKELLPTTLLAEWH